MERFPPYTFVTMTHGDRDTALRANGLSGKAGTPTIFAFRLKIVRQPETPTRLTQMRSWPGIVAKIARTEYAQYKDASQ